MALSLKRSVTKRFFFSIAIVSALSASLLTAAFILFPYLVSSKWLKTHLETRISHILKSPVRFEKMSWKWEGKLRVEGIQVPDIPTFSKKSIASIKAAEINLSWAELIKNRLLFLDVTINGLSIKLIRGPSGGTHIDTKVFSGTAKKIKKPAQKPIPPQRPAIWPFTDLKGRIRLIDLNLHVTDRFQNRTIALTKGRIDLKFPSIIKDPVSLTLFSQVAINHQKASPIQIDMLVRDFFHPEKWVDTDHIFVDLNVAAPGTKITISGNSTLKWVKSRLESDLAISVPLLSPFLKSNLSDLKAKGKLIIDLSAKTDPQNLLSFKTDLTGNKISLYGTLFKNVPIQMDLIKISNNGTFDFSKNQLRINAGLLQLSENRIHWQGTIEHLGHASPAVQISFNEITLFPSDILEWTDRFLPGHLPRILLDKKAPPARFEAAEAQLSGDLMSGPLRVKIRNATLTGTKIAVLTVNPNRPKFQAKQFHLSISELQTTLIDLFPRRIDISGSMSSSNIKVDGENPVSAEQVRLSRFSFSADDIFKSAAARFGVTCRFSLSTSLQTGQITSQGLLSLAKMDQSLTLDGKFASNNLAQLSIKTLKFNMVDVAVINPKWGNFRSSIDFKAILPVIEWNQTDPLKLTLKNPKADLKLIDLKITHPRLGVIQTGGNLTAKADMIELHQTDPSRLNVRDFTSQFKIPGFLNLQVQADTKNSGRSMAKTKGSANVNLSELFKTFHLKSMDIKPIKGQVDLKWNFSGRLPQETELNRMKPALFLNQRDTLSFIDAFGISLLLKGVDVDGLLTKNLKVGLGEITTETPLTYFFNKTTGDSRFKGNMVMANITGVSSFLNKMPLSIPPMTVRLGFSGTHHGLDDFTLSQSLDIKPLDIKETLNFSLSGIRGLLDSGGRLNLKQWLTSLNGSADLTLQIKNGKRFHLLPQALKMDGGADMGASIRLKRASDIDIHGWVRTSGIDIKIGNLLDIKKLKADIDFNKRYLIINKGVTTSKTSYLSSRVIRKNPWIETETPGRQNPISSLNSTWQPRLGRRHTLSLASAQIRKPPLSLKLDHIGADLEIIDGYPNLKYFQTDLLGGSIIGALRIFKKDKQFFIKSDLAFTGLDLKKIAVKGEIRSDPADYSIGGQLAMSFPLSTALRPQMEQLQLELQFSHIGPRALGRMLYLMDPYETNQTIVSQRRILRNGTPRWIEIQVKDGILSLDGEVAMKGINFKIPHLERLNIIDIVARDKFNKNIAFIKPIIDILELATQPSIVLRQKKIQ